MVDGRLPSAVGRNVLERGRRTEKSAFCIRVYERTVITAPINRLVHGVRAEYNVFNLDVIGSFFGHELLFSPADRLAGVFFGGANKYPAQNMKQ